MDESTTTINDANPNANMYGCLPCPKCGKRYRWPQKKLDDGRYEVICDDCGFKEIGTDTNSN